MLPPVSRRRGRPRSPASKRHGVHIRFAADEYLALRRIARLNGLALTAFIRDAVVEAVADCTDERVLCG